jgi:hypothetical protein
MLLKKKAFHDLKKQLPFTAYNFFKGVLNQGLRNADGPLSHAIQESL